MHSSFFLSITRIFLPSSCMICSLAKPDRVLMAFDVVMFERWAISSLERDALRVFPSAARPYVSIISRIDSATLPLTCFWVSETSLSFVFTRSSDIAFMNLTASSPFCLSIFDIVCFSNMTTADSSSATTLYGNELSENSDL